MYRNEWVASPVRTRKAAREFRALFGRDVIDCDRVVRSTFPHNRKCFYFYFDGVTRQVMEAPGYEGPSIGYDHFYAEVARAADSE